MRIEKWIREQIRKFINPTWRSVHEQWIRTNTKKTTPNAGRAAIHTTSTSYKHHSTVHDVVRTNTNTFDRNRILCLGFHVTLTLLNRAWTCVRVLHTLREKRCTVMEKCASSISVLLIVRRIRVFHSQKVCCWSVSSMPSAIFERSIRSPVRYFLFLFHFPIRLSRLTRLLYTL